MTSKYRFSRMIRSPCCSRRSARAQCIRFAGIAVPFGLGGSGTLTGKSYYGQITANISSGGTISPGTGNLAGSFTAQQGSLPDINCTHGSITAILTAGTTIGNITAAGTISGNITASGNIASITALLGNLAGTVRSTGGGIGNVFVGGTMSGSLFANAGSVGAMIVWDNITSGSTISAGAGELDILCLGNVDGSITASTNVTLVAGGTVSGDVTTSYGNVYIRSGGSILSSTISAGIDIALSARGDITSGLIFATNNVSLTAAGNISAPDVESTETGIVTETAGNMIKGSNATAAVVDFSAYTINTSNLMGSVESSAIAHAINGSTLDGNPMVVPVCFAAGTPVLLADGTTVRIERMAEKMRVPGLPENDVSGKPIVCEVEKVFHNRPARIWHVHVAGHVIRCTALHPFYVTGKGWIHAKDLLPGDLLISNTGETLAVRKVEDSGVDEPVYNLRVKEAHTYFVALGQDGPGVLVHNDCGGPTPSPSGTPRQTFAEEHKPNWNLNPPRLTDDDFRASFTLSTETIRDTVEEVRNRVIAMEIAGKTDAADYWYKQWLDWKIVYGNRLHDDEQAVIREMAETNDVDGYMRLYNTDRATASYNLEYRRKTMQLEAHSYGIESYVSADNRSDAEKTAGEAAMASYIWWRDWNAYHDPENTMNFAAGVVYGELSFSVGQGPIPCSGGWATGATLVPNPGYLGEYGPLTGEVIFVIPKAGATPAEIAQIEEYVRGANYAIKGGYLSPTGRVATGGNLRYEADVEIAVERARAAAAGRPYTGHAGHVPDTTWTGRADPYSWLDLTPSVNTSLGRQARNYPLGFKPVEFIFLRPQ